MCGRGRMSSHQESKKQDDARSEQVQVCQTLWSDGALLPCPFLAIRSWSWQGTAMQNRYGEMWTILDWAFPGKLGTKEDWKAWVESPITRAQRHNCSLPELAVGRVRRHSLVYLPLELTSTRRNEHNS
jgi:hypothetical protein